MAYSLPELVLVGAAQNLVLDTSSLELKQTPFCEPIVRPDVDAALWYNEEINW